MTEAKPAPILRDRVVLITGATDGIGRQTVLQLALLGATVMIHGRSAERANETAAWVAREAGVPPPQTLIADLSALADVRRLAEDAQGAYGRLDVLLNNAGVYRTERTLTGDGIEMTFAVNHLAPFLLTNLLLPLLAQSNSARVITVSSIAHQRARLDWQNLQGETAFDPYGAYALSKLCNVLFAFELDRRCKGSAIASNALHPGVITTKLLMQGFGATGAPVEDGARTSVYLASSPEVEGASGQYFVDKRVERASALARNPENQGRLWDISAELCGLA